MCDAAELNGFEALHKKVLMCERHDGNASPEKLVDSSDLVSRVEKCNESEELGRSAKVIVRRSERKAALLLPCHRAVIGDNMDST